MALDTCSHCGNEVPLTAQRCPHCALPSLFPNVRVADEPTEKKALEKRYEEAVQQAVSRGCESAVRGFAEAMRQTRAVINRPIGEVQRLAKADNEAYVTYYQLAQSGSRIPQGDEWDKRRSVTDEALFPRYRDDIRFGALTLDGQGIWHYGDFAVVLRDKMIAHRASVFEENSVVFMKRHDIKVYDVDKLPLGYRAKWDDREKVCVAKLADRLDTGTSDAQYASILMSQGKLPEEDEFVEVHIWGPLTRRCFERILRRKVNLRGAAKVMFQDLQDRLEPIGVPVATSL